MDMKCTCDCSRMKSDLPISTLWLQWQVATSKSKTATYVVISLKLPSHCDKFESTIAWFFSQFSLSVLTMPHPTPRGMRHEVFALALEGMRKSSIAGHMEAPVFCQLPPFPLGVSTKVTEPDNSPLAPRHHVRWQVPIPTLIGRWQAKGTSFTWWALPAKVPVSSTGGFCETP